MNPVRTKQRGVGLLEILIAVVVLSVGFLAAARMQVQGMRFSQSAYFRSQASFMVNDMIDRMRSNFAGVSLGYYDAIDASASAPDPGCDLLTCDPADLRNQDIHDWSAYLYDLNNAGDRFRPLLPGTTEIPANAQVRSLGDGVYAISVSWSESIGDNDEPQDLTVHFVPEV